MADIAKMTDLLERIARAQLWDEPDEDGEMSGKNGDGVSREWQEAREEEAQDWILEARAILENRETQMRSGNPPMIQIRDRTGKEPCGECRLAEGETCDICGASLPSK